MGEALVIAICLVLNGLFAAVEMAFVTVTKARLREVARAAGHRGGRDARRILVLRENPERTLSIIQIGITIVGSVAAAVGGVGAMNTISPWLRDHWALSEWGADAAAVVVVVVPITYVNVVLGELVPKTLALKNSLRIVLVSAKWLVLFDRCLSPVVSVLEFSTRSVLKLIDAVKNPQRLLRAVATPGVVTDSRPSLTESSTAQEISSPSIELEHLSEKTREYVLNLVDLENKRIRDVRLPWTNVIHVKLSDEADDVEQQVLASGHTRLPVMDGREVAGILNTKEFIVLRSTRQDGDWRHLVRPVVRVDESAPILRALRRMQDQRSHLSITYKNGAISGIVTIEDIFEEIIGDIFDEDDDGKLLRVLSTGTGARFRAYAAKNDGSR